MPYKNPKDRQAAQKRYNQTSKGRAAIHRANMSSAAKARRRAYNKTDAGKAVSNQSYFRRRMKVLEHYSGSPPKCACCQITEEMYLALDHLNGGGNRQRKTLGGANNLYVWLVRNNFPPGFQVLCHNCNWAKRLGKACLHKKST